MGAKDGVIDDESFSWEGQRPPYKGARGRPRVKPKV